ncbi:hypothetical protein ACFX1R_046266 [Malus domestica]
MALETIDLRTKEDPRPLQISGLLGAEDQAKIVSLLHKFKDCFAWHYIEMPGLNSTLVEYRMPINEGYKPIKNINGAMLKDEYPMSMADLSIDAVAKHKVLSFMNGNAGYNQIKMAKEEIHKQLLDAQDMSKHMNTW